MYRKNTLLFYYFIIFSLITSLLYASELHDHDHNEFHRMDKLVVSASPTPVSPLDSITPISLIDESELLLSAQTSLGETLQEEIGISSTAFAPGASRPIIRGLSGDRIRILSNGTGSGDVSNTSDDHAVSKDSLNVKKIEILRGPATLRYGSNAIGGVVNIIDNIIPEEVPEKPVSATIDGRYGSADELKSGALKVEGHIDSKFAWHIDTFYRETKDIDIPGFAESKTLRDLEHSEEEGEHEDEHGHDEEEGEHEDEHGHDEEEELAKDTLPGSATKSDGFNVGGSYIWDKGFVGFSVGQYNSDYGVPGHAHGDEHGHDEEEGEHEDEHGHDEEEESVEIQLEQTRFESRGLFFEPFTGIDSLRFNIGWTEYEHVELEGSETGTIFNQDSFEGRIEAFHSPIGELKGTLGIQFLESDFEAIGEEAFVPPSENSSIAFFIFEEFEKNDQLKFQFGARIEDNQVKPESSYNLEDKSFTSTSLSGGFIWSPDQSYSLSLSTAYTERAPTSTELFSNGAHIATRSFELGDSNLDNEESIGFDLALRKKAGIFQGSFNVFYNTFDSFISKTPNGETEDGFPVFLYQSVEAELYGFELEFDIEVWKQGNNHILLELGSDYTRAENTTLNEPLPRIPPMRYMAGISYHSSNWDAKINTITAQKQDRISQFEIETGSYTLLNASLVYHLTFGNDEKHADLFLKATNLTDEEARIHSSFLKDQVPLKGRSFEVGCRIMI